MRVGARVRRGAVDGPVTAAGTRAAFAAEGLAPTTWSNSPGDTYARHEHSYHKVLYCVAGSIVFHTADGDLALGPGDRLDLDPGTPHFATVGRAGVTCMEAQAVRRTVQ
jgi:quercetin dioxygenase-like cupin family protein